MARSTPLTAPATSTTLRFAEVSRAIGQALQELGLQVPVFRSPPKLPGRDRTVRRRPTGGVAVAVRVNDRPFGAVVADLIEGACVANRLGIDEAEAARARMWDAVDAAGQLGPGERPGLAAA